MSETQILSPQGRKVAGVSIYVGEWPHMRLSTRCLTHHGGSIPTGKRNATREDRCEVCGKLLSYSYEKRP